MVKVAKIAGLKTQAFTNGLPLTEDKADKIINNPDFSKIYKILEFRNTNIAKIKQIINYF